MAFTEAGRQHEKDMEQMKLDAEAQKRREENALTEKCRSKNKIQPACR